MTVLLVDDFSDALEVWDLFLTSAGFTVVTATNGIDGLAQAQALRPDVIVLDLQMPGLSGPEVARALRADAATRHIPLIAATGHSPTFDDDNRTEGFDSVIVKPCDPETLVAEIRRVAAARPAAPAVSAVTPDRT
jgi:two-component system, cell cycle response regulator DivK